MHRYTHIYTYTSWFLQELNIKNDQLLSSFIEGPVNPFQNYPSRILQFYSAIFSPVSLFTAETVSFFTTKLTGVLKQITLQVFTQTNTPWNSHSAKNLKNYTKATQCMCVYKVSGKKYTVMFHHHCKLSQIKHPLLDGTFSAR